jgi:hypothetical protein
MSDRDELSAATDRLRAAAAKAARELHRAQPITAASVYDAVIERVDELTAQVADIGATARTTRPAGT